MIPIGDADFWWLRYFGGLVAPILLVIGGVASLITRHSYTIWGGQRRLSIVPVQGEQAVLMGCCYLGLALALFSYCYLQYHEKGAYYYEWPLAVGAVVAGGSMCWCSYIFILG